MIGQLTAVSLIALTLVSAVTSDAVRFRADAGAYVNWQFKLKPRTGVEDVSVISLNWEPFFMVENPDGLQKEDFGVEIKSGEGEFVAIEEQPRLRGGKYHYDINIVPCEEQSIRFFVKDGEGDPVYFLYPEVIAASTNEDIAKSSFELSPVQDGSAVVSGDEVRLSWSPSKCATSYLLTGLETEEREVSGTEESLALSSLTEECRQYDVYVTAVNGDKYSDSLLLPSIPTRPSTTAVDSLKVDLFPSQNSLTARWNGHKSMPCVTTYSVRLCEEGGECQDTVTLTVDQGLSYVEFNSQQELTECSNYELFIKPEYPETDMKELGLKFTTSSPEPSDLSTILSSVSAIMTSEQSVLVSWQGGKCVSHYKVFQQAVTSPPTDQWDEVADLPSQAGLQHQLTLPGVPCTQFKYAVTALIDGTETEKVEAQETVDIPLKKDEPYTATGLSTTVSPSSLEVTWDHPRCVESYRVQACPLTPQGPQTEDCQQITVTPEEDSTHVMGLVDQLEPCTDYQLDIFATTGGQEIAGASSSTFRSEAPEIVEPASFSLNQLDLSFEPVVCATKYKVYEKIGEEPEQMIKEIDGTSVSIASPPACSDHRYAVAAVVGDSEGPKTKFEVVKVAPKNDEQPTLQVGDGNNNTIEVKILAPNANMECEVESYQVRYQTLGEDADEEFTSAELSDGIIVLTEVDNKMVEGRIKYLDYDWSPWTESQKTEENQSTQESKGMLVPVVIVVLLVVVILVTVIFFIVRRKKRSQNKYNCDNGDKSETKKLNGDGDP